MRRRDRIHSTDIRRLQELPGRVAASELTELLMPAHCTGWKAVHRLAHRFPDAFVQSAVGTTISL